MNENCIILITVEYMFFLIGVVFIKLLSSNKERIRVDGYINKKTHYIIYEEKSGIYEINGNFIYVRIFVVCNVIKNVLGKPKGN